MVHSKIGSVSFFMALGLVSLIGCGSPDGEKKPATETEEVEVDPSTVVVETEVTKPVAVAATATEVATQTEQAAAEECEEPAGVDAATNTDATYTTSSSEIGREAAKIVPVAPQFGRRTSDITDITKAAPSSVAEALGHAVRAETRTDFRRKASDITCPRKSSVADALGTSTIADERTSFGRVKTDIHGNQDGVASALGTTTIADERTSFGRVKTDATDPAAILARRAAKLALIAASHAAADAANQ